MKKVFGTVIIFIAIFFVQCAYACSSLEGNTTGGACSIKELNNLENNGTVKNKTGFFSSREKDLRPIKPDNSIQKINNNCLFGMCLYQQLLEKTNEP